MHTAIRFLFPVPMCMSGDEANAATGESEAKLWKNGTATVISSIRSNASSVFVSGSDVYVTGDERNAAGNSGGKLWKNGTASALSVSPIASSANSVFVK